MPGRPPLRTALGAAVALLAAACTSTPEPPGPVEVAAPPAAAAPALEACRALLGQVPDSLGEGLARRASTADAERVAAWGDPAVVLTCAAPPAGLPGVDGEPFEFGPPEGGTLAWLVDDVGAANLWTTRDRAVPVSVVVPDAYDAQALAPLAGPLLRVLAEAPVAPS